MNKAEEGALKAYPIIMHTLIPVHDNMPDIEQDCNKFHRQAYIKGYHQAEEDLELSWEDIESICSIQYIVLNEYNDYDEPSSNILYQEVLKRFKDLKYVK